MLCWKAITTLALLRVHPFIIYLYTYLKTEVDVSWSRKISFTCISHFVLQDNSNFLNGKCLVTLFMVERVSEKKHIQIRSALLCVSYWMNGRSFETLWTACTLNMAIKNVMLFVACRKVLVKIVSFHLSSGN